MRNFLRSAKEKYWRPLLLLFIVAIWPFIHFANENKDSYWIGWQIIALPLLLFAGTAGILISIANISSKLSLVRIANSIAVTVLIFFAYGAVEFILKDVLEFPTNARGFVRERYVLGIWMAIATGSIIITWYLARGWRGWLVLVTMSGVATLPPLVELTAASIRNMQFVESAAKEGSIFHSEIDASTNPKVLPNIYYLIFDMYARDDTLKLEFGWNNIPFLREMEKREFFVGRNGYTNYPSTMESLGATLSMEYLGKYYTPREGKRLDLVYIGNNHVVKGLTKAGYSFVFAPRDGKYCVGYETLCLVEPRKFGFLPIGDVEFGMLQMTPIYRILQAGFGLFGQAAQSPQEFRSKVKALPKSTQAPWFVFYHNMDIHEYLVRIEGDVCARTVVNAPLPQSNFDEIRKNDYLEAIMCTNEEIILTVDQIIDSDPNSIIIIQSDHGVRFGEEALVEDWSHEELQGRYGFLNMLRMPDKCEERLYSSISPINTFRVLFGCLGLYEMSLLPDESFVPIMNGPQPRKIDFAR